ncbi:hypothetical protein GE061_001790 [Apolygus lucorum]|uniref:Uncharacterized protein n=1 Tax=Apolygus lucorum TaxID=248454 RepID=A0A6A4JE37_APOLU|nr:hypothetical protein GE061_001790 [Apolygus lucorum]
MNMYNMFNPYMYSGYGQNYYQYYQQGMQHYMNQAAQHPEGNQYRGFTPGGNLTSFQAPSQVQQPPQPAQPQTPNTNANSSDPADDLPPLPPGPPPHKGNNLPGGNNQGPTPPSNFNSGVIQQGPVKFMMNAPRPRMNLQGNAFNQQQQNQQQGVGGGSAKSRRKKKKKMQQQQARQQQMMHQKQQVQQFQWNHQPQNHNQNDTPPLPDAPPPPLPPGSPPPPPPPPTKVTEPNENNAGASNINLPPMAPAGQPPFQSPMPVLPSAAQVQNQGVKALDEWPAPLRDYVGRCYAKCVTQIDQDRVGVILKGKLMRATNDGTLWTKDWASEPLPLLDSDSKAVMNLKEKLSRQSITSRLGPRTGSPTVPNRKRASLPTRGSGRSTYRSDSSSSRSSRSSSSSRRSRSRSPRSSKKTARAPNKKSRGNHTNSRRNNNYSNSHFYSEFGIIGGSEDLNVKKEVLDKRAARFSAPGATKQPTLSSAIGNRLGSMNKDSAGPPRKKHNPLFVIDNGPSNNGGNGSANCGDYEVSDLHIIGTCEDLEKGYLRLTSAPEASQVRPKSVLIKSLEMVKAKWVKDRDYHYTFEQLKSIRQDLTVQGIRDALSVDVYETHARIALEMKDHAEFNQCQSQLRILHEEVVDASENKIEFKAYGILYFIFTKDFMELSTRLCSLTKEEKEDECVRHAVSLARAWMVGNHVRIFKLYKSAPKMSSYLIDLFVGRERLAYFKVIMKAYRPSIPLDFVKSELELDTDTDVDAFLTSVGNVSFVDASRTLIDCKAFQG